MENQVDGKVVSVTESGDLLTDIENQKIETAPRDESVSISFGDHHTVGLFPPDHEEPESTLVAVLGESGFLEIGIVGMNLSQLLGINSGQAVTVSW